MSLDIEELEIRELVDYVEAIYGVPKERFRIIGDLGKELKSKKCYFIVDDYESLVEARAVARIRENHEGDLYSSGLGSECFFHVVDDTGEEVWSSLEDL